MKQGLTAKEVKKWYFGTRLGKWYREYPSKVPEYKKDEGFTNTEFKRLGKAEAQKRALAPNFIHSKHLSKKEKEALA